MKSFYNIPKAENHWFITYYMYYKEKLGIIKSIYDPYLFFLSNLLKIMRM